MFALFGSLVAGALSAAMIIRDYFSQSPVMETFVAQTPRMADSQMAAAPLAEGSQVAAQKAVEQSSNLSIWVALLVISILVLIYALWRVWKARSS